MPAEIDLTNADHVGETLAAAMHPGLRVLIADLTSTTFCDLAGVRVFALVRRQAMKNRTALRLVVRSGAVQRALQAIELDRLVPIYTSLSTAMAPAIEVVSPAGAGSPGFTGAPISPPLPSTPGRRPPLGR